MDFFVDKDSVVRKIWGKGDTILFIFAGSAAEFALNKAADWLYFTGRLPADPMGRLFSTVTYARQIVFSEREAALASIDRITSIHQTVEQNRDQKIPDWAYRDVLFMLIDYSVRSFELLERKLTDAEKEEVFNVFYQVGQRMDLQGLPLNYRQWLPMREEHLLNHTQKSNYTVDLYRQYRKHLGWFRYEILLEAQKLVIPERVRHLLQLSNLKWLMPALKIYKLSRIFKLEWFLKWVILPGEYKTQIMALDDPGTKSIEQKMQGRQ